MKSLRLTIVQSNLHWENKPANLDMFSKKLAGLAGTTDLVLLPEMFSTGFSMNAKKLAEPMDGSTMQWLKDQSARINAVVAGSFIAVEEDRFYNRFVWMRPDGTFGCYDKRHLFTLAGEHESYSPGDKRRLIEWEGWKICPLICYDLRFPVWSRNTENFDLLLYVANWPERRSPHWRQLLIARAIENQCYVAGVNRVGKDGTGLSYTGDSSLIDFSGKIRYCLSETEAVLTTELTLPDLREYRKNLPFLNDRDDFILT
jgi:predicted amidohydrolase